MTKRVREVLDPLNKVFKTSGCPKCGSTTLVFTIRLHTTPYDPADLVRCPRYLSGCGWRMTKEECVEKYGDEKKVLL